MTLRIIVIVLTALSLPLSAWSAQALRVICENHSTSSSLINSLRSDVTPSYLTAQIKVIDSNSNSLDKISRLHLLNSNGLSAQAILMAAAPKSGVYFVDINFPKKVANATLLGLVDGATTYAPFAVVQNEVWLLAGKNKINVYTLPGLSLKHSLSTSQTLLGLSADANRIFTIESHNSNLMLNEWNEKSKSWTAVALPTLKSHLPLQVKIINNSVYVWSYDGATMQWNLIHQNKNILSVKAYRESSAPAMLALNGKIVVAWAEESYQGSQHYGQVFLYNLETQKVESVPYPESLLKRTKSLPPRASNVFTPLALDSANQTLIFSSGAIGGIVSMDLNSFVFKFHGFSEYLCYNPSFIEETTPW